MATDTEKLVLLLEARTNRFEKALANADRSADRRARSIESRFSKMNRNINRSFQGALRGALPALGVGIVAREFTQLADANTRIVNALKVTGLEGTKLSAVYDQLFASAQKNYAPVESLVTLYSRAALVQSELGISTQELLGFTDNVALALRVQGSSAAEAQGALLQLSQALGAGTVRAEEFNSILEGAPTIARAVALGLTEAGGSVAKLRALVIDGQISSEAFFRAFEAGAPSLAAQVSDASVTVDQAMTRVQNVLIDAAGEFDKTTGFSEALTDSIDSFAGAVPGFATAAANIASAVGGIRAAFIDTIQTIQDYATAAGQAVGADKLGRALLTSRAGDTLRGLGVNSVLDADNRRPDGLAGNTGPLEIGLVKPVSITDFTAASGKSAGKSKSGAGSKKTKAPRANEYEREVKSIRDRTAALQAETAAQATLNPLVDDYGLAVETARQKQDLLTAAQEAGLKVTPELEASIEALAAGYAIASADAIRLAEAQDEVRQRAEEFQALGKDVARGFIDDLRSGKTAAEALEGALGKVADKLLDIALNSAFDSGDGAIGGLLKSLFGGGGSSAASLFKAGKGGLFAKGGISNAPAIFGEAGPEAAVPLPDGRSIPVSLKSPVGGNSQHVQVTVGIAGDGMNIVPMVREVVVDGIRQAAPQIVQASMRAGDDRFMAGASSR